MKNGQRFLSTSDFFHYRLRSSSFPDLFPKEKMTSENVPPATSASSPRKSKGSSGGAAGSTSSSAADDFPPTAAKNKNSSNNNNNSPPSSLAALHSNAAALHRAGDLEGAAEGYSAAIGASRRHSVVHRDLHVCFW